MVVVVVGSRGDGSSDTSGSSKGPNSKIGPATRGNIPIMPNSKVNKLTNLATFNATKNLPKINITIRGILRKKIKAIIKIFALINKNLNKTITNRMVMS